MRRAERIPKHDHTDDNSGGRLDASVLRNLPLYSVGTTGGGSGTSTGSDPDAELNTEGGQSVIHAHGTVGSTETIDPTLGNVHSLTLDDDCTITVSAPVGSGAATLELWVTQDGTGGWAITWSGGVTEEGTHDTTAGTTQRVILESIDAGTTWIATWVGASSGAPATTVEDETTFGITPAVGTDTEYARQDHTHGTPANPASAAVISALGFVGEILISDSPSTPLVFADLIQNEAQDDLLYADIP